MVYYRFRLIRNIYTVGKQWDNVIAGILTILCLANFIFDMVASGTGSLSVLSISQFIGGLWELSVLILDSVLSFIFLYKIIKIRQELNPFVRTNTAATTKTRTKDGGNYSNSTDHDASDKDFPSLVKHIGYPLLVPWICVPTVIIVKFLSSTPKLALAISFIGILGYPFVVIFSVRFQIAIKEILENPSRIPTKASEKNSSPGISLKSSIIV